MSDLVAATDAAADAAQRLSLSVRTVENHIYKAMAKTATTSRDQLAGLMPGAPNAVPPS